MNLQIALMALKAELYDLGQRPGTYEEWRTDSRVDSVKTAIRHLEDCNKELESVQSNCNCPTNAPGLSRTP